MDSWKIGKIDSLLYKIYNFFRNDLNQKLAVYLYSFISGKNNVYVVEAGSGPGFCASVLNKKENISAVILDLDLEALKLAKSRKGSIRAVKGDILRMPFLNDSFDLIYNSSTLEHLSDYNKAFSEMVRVCKPGGYVFVGIPFRYGPLAIFNFFPENSKIREWIGKFIPCEDIRNWADSCPITFIDEIYYFYGFFKGFMFRKNSN